METDVVVQNRLIVRSYTVIGAFFTARLSQ